MAHDGSFSGGRVRRGSEGVLNEQLQMVCLQKHWPFLVWDHWDGPFGGVLWIIWDPIYPSGSQLPLYKEPGILGI